MSDLSTLISEVNEYERERNWQILYMDLLHRQENQDYSIDAAISKGNMLKNRYRDVLPNDYFRVKLNRHPDYINANRCVVPLDGVDLCKSYIMTQGPLEETSGDFWEMVWQEKCANIVMLTNTIENRTMKCHQYFPDVDQPKCSYASVVGTFVIRLIEQKKSSDFTVRKLSLELSGQSEVRSVTHFHYTGWPDHGVPENPMSFVKFFFYLSSLNVLPAIPKHNNESSPAEDNSNPPPPPILHCSAGIGRTGVLCVVDSCYTMLSNNCEINLEKVIDIIMALRLCRKGAVQTPEQLRFVCFAIQSVGLAIQENSVQAFVDDAASSFEHCTKKSIKRPVASSVESEFSPNIPVPLPTQPARIPTARSSSTTTPASDSANKQNELLSVPSRRSLDSRFVQQESDAKKRRTDFLSQNWYFWALTKLQNATGNRQGLAVVTLAVVAFAVGVGFWKRSP